MSPALGNSLPPAPTCLVLICLLSKQGIYYVNTRCFRKKKKNNSIQRTPKEQKTWSFSSRFQWPQIPCFVLFSFVFVYLFTLEVIAKKILTPYWSYYLQIFSPSVDCLFVLYMVSFAIQKLLNLIRPPLLIFPFVSFALGK